MTKLEFMDICGEHGIDVGVALENSEVREALKESLESNDDQNVRQALAENF